MVRNTKGSVLLIMFVFLVFLSVVMSAFMLVITAGGRQGAAHVARAQALWIAEAGVHNVLYALRNNQAFVASPYVLTGDVGNGSYTVTTTRNGKNYAVIAIGTVGQIARQIRRTIFLGSGFWETFTEGIYTGGKITFKKETAGTVTGDITTANVVQGIEKILLVGRLIERADILIPSVDYDYYRAIADHSVASDYTFTANKTYAGIWYIDGSATIENNVVINGSVIATRNILLNGADNTTITAEAGYPALVASASFSMQGTDSVTVNGLLYAENSITLKNVTQSTFSGALIADKKITIDSSTQWSITFDDTLQSGLLGFSGGLDDIVITPQKDWDDTIL